MIAFIHEDLLAANVLFYSYSLFAGAKLECVDENKNLELLACFIKADEMLWK